MTFATSTITFFYTDIEGSTRLWERQPEAMRAALTRHDEILTQAIEKNGGRVFRTAGDAFCASFPAAPSAIKAAVQAQRELCEENWELEQPLRVRIALHTGEAEEHAGDYVGSSLNHIGRLLAVCQGGQTLLTLVTEELVRGHLPEGVRLLDLGEHRFRDLANPEHVYQLAIEGLPDSFPPLKSLSSYPNNLPVLLTNFIGRGHDLQEIRRLLAASRLVTLTGPGGTGKTRLALQTAEEVLEEYPDGAWIIELAPISNPGMIAQSVAVGLNVREQPGRPLLAVIVDALRSKKLLLILDNCEHLIQACADFSLELLRACPGLKIITTSREMLGVPGEMVYRVPSLSLPDASNPTYEEFTQSDSVRLFVERASAIKPQFKLTPENAPVIAQICHRLDGIPLAIELAAARSNLFTPAQIASRLDDAVRPANRNRLLSGGSRAVSPRQQTLEALFDWSYDLLSSDEKVFFWRLSVFSSGWTIEAAEAIQQGAERSDDEPDVLDLLSQMVNKSLVVVDDRGEEARYRMLETIRQYAQKKLDESSEAFEIRKRHMHYYIDIARRTWREIRSSGTEWLNMHKEVMKADVDNFLAAQEWALENDLPAALLFAGSLFYYWETNNFADEVRRFLGKVLRRAEEAPEFQGELDTGRHDLLAGGWTGYGDLLLVLGHNEEALSASEKAIEHARQAGNLATHAYALSIQSVAAGTLGMVELSDISSVEAVDIARKSGEKWILGMALITTAGNSLPAIGKFDRARDYIEEGIRLFRSLKDPYWSALAETFMGMYAVHRGDLETAAESFTSSLKAFGKDGDVFVANMARSGLADTCRLRGDLKASAALYIETIKTWNSLGNLGGVSRCLECLGFISVSLAKNSPPDAWITHLERAATLFGAAETIRKENSAVMNPAEQTEYDQQKAELYRLSEDADSTRLLTEKAWALGSRMSLEEVLLEIA